MDNFNLDIRRPFKCCGAERRARYLTVVSTAIRGGGAAVLLDLDIEPSTFQRSCEPIQTSIVNLKDFREAANNRTSSEEPKPAKRAATQRAACIVRGRRILKPRSPLASSGRPDSRPRNAVPIERRPQVGRETTSSVDSSNGRVRNKHVHSDAHYNGNDTRDHSKTERRDDSDQKTDVRKYFGDESHS